jgi:hypothetical protein
MGPGLWLSGEFTLVFSGLWDGFGKGFLEGLCVRMVVRTPCSWLMNWSLHRVRMAPGLWLSGAFNSHHSGFVVGLDRGGQNTLQLADELVVTQSPDGTWFVAVRWVRL